MMVLIIGEIYMTDRQIINKFYEAARAQGVYASEYLAFVRSVEQSLTTDAVHRVVVKAKIKHPQVTRHVDEPISKVIQDAFEEEVEIEFPFTQEVLDLIRCDYCTTSLDDCK